jgi:hypothetical protein
VDVDHLPCAHVPHQITNTENTRSRDAEVLPRGAKRPLVLAMPRLMDYSLPTAAKVPAIEVLKPESPSPFALGAFKGFESAARSTLRSPWWAR